MSVGLKQSGRVFSAILLLGLLSVCLIWALDRNSGSESVIPLAVQRFVFWIFLISISLLAGPGPFLLTFFDISDRQLFILSSMVVILYWAGLGAVAGIIRWRTHIEDIQLEAGLSWKKLTSEIRFIIVILAALGGTVFFFNTPFLYSPYRGQHFAPLAIRNNLRQIEVAKNLFAQDHHSASGYVPTETDLAPCMNRNDGKLPHVGPEHYVIGAISNSPYAFLDAEWRVPREGWHEGFVIGTNGTIFRLR
jgi:hypothetical protein